MRKKILSATLLVGAIVILTAILWIFVGDPMIAFLKGDSFRDWVEEHGILSRLVFLGMVIFQVIVAVIPGEPFEIAAGYAFGAVEGTTLSIVASAVGSIIIFLLVRAFGMKLVRIFFSEEKINSLKFLKTNPRRNYLFLIIYMIPGTPKDLLSYFVGLTDMKLLPWLMICTLGRIPSVVTSTIGGDALGSHSYLNAILVFAITMVASILGLLLYNYISKKHSKAEKLPQHTKSDL